MNELGDEESGPLNAAIQQLLGAQPTATRRRVVADLLFQKSQDQLARAAATERNGVRFEALRERAAINADRPRGGRPRGSGGRYVRLEQANRHDIATPRWRLHIAPALWQELGSPPRIAIARTNGIITLRAEIVPARSYSVTVPSGLRGGIPRLSGIGQPKIAELGMRAGKFDAHIDAGAIIVVGA